MRFAMGSLSLYFWHHDRIDAMSSPPTALVIDDEVQIRRLLRVALEAAAYSVHEAPTGQEGLQAVAYRRPDVVLLDLGLPDLDGREVLRRLREWSDVPVVVLTVRDSEEEKVAALDAGADDYVTKPFSTAELLARLRAAQRRARTAEEHPIFTAGDLVVDLTARTVHRAGTEIHLTATEYTLLRLFIRHAGRVLTHRQILREVWGPKAEEQRQYLRVHLGNLRKKIEPSGRREPLLRTEPGIGYRLLEA
jgi:two-component system KDP operon response regulator KdpE